MTPEQPRFAGLDAMLADEERQREAYRQWRERRAAQHPCLLPSGHWAHEWMPVGAITPSEAHVRCRKCGAEKTGSGVPWVPDYDNEDPRLRADKMMSEPKRMGDL